MLLHEEVLERLGRVSLTARQAVEAVISGSHRSLRRGLSVEFAGHRPYQPGDDPRHLDWLVWARTDRFDVRQYEEETRLRATLVVDASGSMGFASHPLSKLACARTLAAALAFLMARQGDSVGLAIVDRAVREHLPPAATMGHVVSMLERLERAEEGGETALGPVLESLASRLPPRGLIIILTDALDDPQRIGRALQHLRYRRQDVRLVQVLDPHEQSFPVGGSVEFRGLEGEARLRLDADRVSGWYRGALVRHRRELAEQCHRAGAVLETVRSDEDPAFALVRVLAAAEAAG